ncbi:MAG: hypothetical protein JEY94_18370 [Melioribacteraceae bacterium]|nr:hypothetical protein [Melioribacteraceae bacterium]
MINIKNLQSDFATKSGQEKYINELNNRINTVFAKTVINEKEWRSLFLDLDLAFYTNEAVYNALTRVITDYSRFSNDFQRVILTTVFSLYPNKFTEETSKIFEETNDSQIFVMAAKHLLQNNYKDISIDYINSKIESGFGGRKDDIIEFFLNDLKPDKTEPGIKALLDHSFQKGKTIIYTIFRKDRSFTGITIIKKPNGEFVKDENDSLFFIKQLGTSTSRLPGYLSKGNTPQGIFSIVGSYISPTKSIGPTDNVLIRIPFGKSPKIFFHGKNKYQNWNIEDYKNLLPETWKDYLPVYESFYAGKNGRRLIVMHGSTDNLEFYKNKPYYPLTPTMGCISAKEIWDLETGYCIESDQAKLLNAFYSTKQLKGFLVVVNIDDKKLPVTIKEIRQLLNSK